MESNTMTTYKDLTPAPKVDKKTLNKMVWMSTMLQASFNYERMQSRMAVGYVTWFAENSYK